MKGPPTCPRCGHAVREPGLWSSEWQCDVHGAVQPFRPAVKLGPEIMGLVTRQARTPFWVPHPMPAGWVVTGIGMCGDERSGGRATVLCCSGPAPLGGPADLVVIAEEPGIGIGARFAGLPEVDPGEFTDHAYDAKVHTAGHPSAVWAVPCGADRAVYVGEARGMWLWLVLWPSAAGLMLVEELAFADAREAGPSAYELLGYGAVSPRMAARS